MPNKKGTEKKPRRSEGRKSSADPKKHLENQPDHCSSCHLKLTHHSRALFVEEELGRLFCSEDCIVKFFSTEIKKLEEEYKSRVSIFDLSPAEKEALAHLRWSTLSQPDESWKENSPTGDCLHYLIREYPRDSQENSTGTRVWCVCICLFLRGEPSFLFLAFLTRDESLVNLYRKGERVKRDQKQSINGSMNGVSNQAPMDTSRPMLVDGLAEAWTADETIRAQLSQQRRADDIPQQEYELYQSCLEETLQTPDEVWSTQLQGEDSLKLYYFIKFYPGEDPSIWYIIVARDTEDQEQIEILDAFPTRDSLLVENYRTGIQEVGAMDLHAASRMVH